MGKNSVLLTGGQVSQLSVRLGKGPRLLPVLVRAYGSEGFGWSALDARLRVGEQPRTFVLEGEGPFFDATVAYVTGKSENHRIKATLAYSLQWMEDEGGVIWAAPQGMPFDWAVGLLGRRGQFLHSLFGKNPAPGETILVKVVMGSGSKRRRIPVKFIWESLGRIQVRAPFEHCEMVMNATFPVF